MTHPPTQQRTVIIKHPGLKTLDGGFTAIPNKLLRNTDLSTGARLTYGLLLSYAWQEDFCFPAQDTLAKDLGMTERHIRRHLTELREKGYITWKQQGLNRPNIYYILEIEPSKSNPPTTDPKNSKENKDRTSMSGPERTSMSGQERTPVSDYKDSKKNTQNVNVNDFQKDPKTGSDQDPEPTYETRRAELLVDDILQVTGDRHSRNFYRKLARTVPEGLLRMALSETKDAKLSGRITKTPGACFTDAVKQIARDRQIQLDLKTSTRPHP